MPTIEDERCHMQRYDWTDRRPKTSIYRWHDLPRMDVRKRYDHARKYIALNARHREQRHAQGENQELEKAFREHVNRWKDETGHLSSLARAVAHPSYLRIIGLAKNSKDHQIERLLLHELETDPDHWFDALEAVTGENPVRPEYDFDEALQAWTSWGRENGII